jgi:hypothetical protein
MPHKDRSTSNRDKSSKTSRRGHSGRVIRTVFGNNATTRNVYNNYGELGFFAERIATKRELVRLKQKLSGKVLLNGKNYYF